MARTFAMSTIRTRCQRRADKENDTHIATAEWNALISEAYGELYQIVVDGGGRYFESESSITATGATSYNEPATILQILAIDYVSGTKRRMLDELMVQERESVMGRTGEAFFWEFQDDQIILHPNPATGTYKVVFIPQAPDLSAYADADLVDVCCPAGERFLIWSVAMIAKDKSESGFALCQRESDRARQDLQMWAANRALTNPRHRTVRDVDAVPRDPADWYYGR